MDITNADILSKLDRLQELIQGGKIDSSNIEVNSKIDIDDYMYGLYNGMELATAMLEDREVEFRV